MKRIFLPLFILSSFPAFAQMNCPTFTRYGGFDRWEISPLVSTVDPYPFDEFVLSSAYLSAGDLRDHSLAAGVIVKFFLDENIAVRLKLIFANRSLQNLVSIIDTSSGNTHSDNEKVTQTLFKIAPGFQWTFFENHISFYGGFEAPFTLQNDLTQVGSGIDLAPGDTAPTFHSFHRTVPGGYSAGIGIFGGSTYYFTHFFGAGFELSAAYQYTSIGGLITSSDASASGSSTAIAISSYVETQERFGFTPVQALIFVTFRF
ncbi:MAG TPA: hypothetical protein VE978_20155 [Chitinophagales bacterium]|nr:hypothetical protein [Chitinophagales bacterium]